MKKPFRKNVALAIDGGGFRGLMVAKALSMLEQKLNKSCGEIFSLTAGTSTGSIISAAVSLGITASQIYELYRELGRTIFRKSLRSIKPFCYLAHYKYSNRPLKKALRHYLGEVTMGKFWQDNPKKDLVITVRDLVENRTRFVKSWKREYKDWKIWYVVLASCSVPTYFPVVDGRYVDGGVGSFSNPCYIAAYEVKFCLKEWDPEQTTLISIGTGRAKKGFEPYQADKFCSFSWINPLVDTFLSDSNDQQVRVVKRFFEGLDFRRFQINIGPIAMDDPSKVDELTAYGEKLGQMILNDEQDDEVENPHEEVRL
jgi:hypothetical protein